VHLRGPDGTRRARTDVEGNVELLALQPGRYEVDVKCEGFVAEPEYPPIELGASSSVELAWEVHVGAALRGVVVDARGRPLPRMLVNGISLGEAPTRVLPAAIHPTDAEGHFAMLGVSPGRYQLRASGPDGDSEALDVEVRGPNELTDLRLVVPEGGSLRGRVIDGRASPRPQVEILLERSDERRATANARSNDLGEFDIAWLEPGPYRVSVVGDPSSEAVQIHAGEQAQVELEVATHDGVITGRVLDSDGAPVSDAFVAAIAMTEQATAPLAAQRAAALARSNWSAIAEPTLTDVEGRFTSSGLPPGEYIVHAHRKGGGTAVADSVALGSDVSLRLSVTGSLAGTVALADGTLLEVFDITLTALEQGFVRRDDFFRTKGAWSFGELPAARLRVQVEAPEGTATVEVSLGEGEAREQLEIVLQPRVTLTGRIVDLDSGEPLAGMLVTVTGGLAAETSSTRNGLSDAQGRFRVLAPSGEVTLFIGPEGGTAGSDYEYLWTPRSIPADPSTQELGDIGLIAKRLHDGERPGDIGFELAPPSAGIDPSERRAELALVHPGGPAAAAGLRVGDVIEQVDGKSVVGRDFDRFPTLTRVPAGTVLSLVTADGRTVALTVGAA
jgi:protocatechuate 3,4-dioxygenase beta subunit